MPKRIKSHNTGSAAVNKLRSLISNSVANWAVREKPEDYGVDLEIEVFDGQTERHTNLMAYVQVKGTAANTKNGGPSISVESLQYLTSFQIPSLIFWYNANTDTSYWMWAHEALWHSKSGASSVSLPCDSQYLWRDETTIEIERTLSAALTLKYPQITTRFPLIALTEFSNINPLELIAIVDEVNRSAPYFDALELCPLVPIGISVNGKQVLIKIERYLWRAVEADDESISSLTNAVIYLLISFLYEFNFIKQSEVLALKCLEQKRILSNRELSSRACISLLGFPDKAVELAELNSLHQNSDLVGRLFAFALHNAIVPYNGKISAVENYTDLIIKFGQADSEKQTAIYNLSVIYRNGGDFLSCFKCLNRLRKMDTEYTSRSYYWKELSGVLYMLGRAAGSAKCYKNLVEIEGVSAARLLYGDALLSSKQFETARVEFDKAQSDQTSTGSEAFLKYYICEWILKNSDEAFDVDNYDNLFELRSKFHEKNDYHNMFWVHMMMSFICRGDPEFWSDAIMFGFLVDDSIVIHHVLKLSISLFGLEAYFLFKERRQDFYKELIAENLCLDDVARDIFNEMRIEEEYRPGVHSGERKRMFEEGTLRAEGLYLNS